MDGKEWSKTKNVVVGSEVGRSIGVIPFVSQLVSCSVATSHENRTLARELLISLSNAKNESDKLS
jgi:hypothetical protein